MNVFLRSFPSAAMLLLMASLALAQSSGEPQHTLLFDSGREGYPRYRIPSLIVSPQGTLLAICEGRKDGGGLEGNIDLVMKRSFDSGRTWQPMTLVADDGPNTLGNPVAVVDQKTGTIWMALTRSFGEDTEPEIVDETSQESVRVWITHSRDDGASWSKPIDITGAVKPSDWTWYGTGPGIGIQLAGGRLVIPCYHAVAKTKVRSSHVIFSDDHGKTWKLGGSAGDNNGESQVAERRDGTLYLTARTSRGPIFSRTIATSADGGETWSKTMLDEKLYDPHCQASILSLTAADGDGNPRWLYCHPPGPGRTNLTVRLSHDEGRTWPIGKRLREGDGQYSSLAMLPDGSIGCLHDLWEKDNYRVYFARFTLDWLTDGKGGGKSP